MHDPSTVAHEIKYPWWAYRPWPKDRLRMLDRDWSPRDVWEQMDPAERAGRNGAWPNGYRRSFITIWHVDPERDGSDDSCGYCFPRLTPEQRRRLKNAARSEGRDPYFLRQTGEKYQGTRIAAEGMYRGLVLLVADVLNIPLTFDEAARFASRKIHNPDCTDAANCFCFKHGYHTNFPNTERSSEDDQRMRQERFAGILGGIAVEILRSRRPWWRHPKWHIHHWRLQVHPWQALRRHLFDRCCKCGRGFKRGESVMSGCWDTPKAKLFRSTPYLYHDRCYPRSAPSETAPASCGS